MSRRRELMNRIGRSYKFMANFIYTLETHKRSEGIDNYQEEFLGRLKGIYRYVSHSRSYDAQMGRLSRRELEEYARYIESFIDKALNYRTSGPINLSMYSEMNRRYLTDPPGPAFRPAGPVYPSFPENYRLNVRLWFVKSEKKIRIVQIKSAPGWPDQIIYRRDGQNELYNASNEVQGSRPDYSDCHPQTGSGVIREDLYYQPERFPNGAWEIRSPDGRRKGTTNDEGMGLDVFRFNAHQPVTLMERNEEGKWEKTATKVEDYGYNIHAGTGAASAWTYWTRGCIRVEASTINRLSELYDEVRRTGGVIILTVSETGNPEVLQ